MVSDTTLMKKIELVIFRTLLITFEVLGQLEHLRTWGNSENWLDPKIKLPNQGKLLEISNTHDIYRMKTCLIY